MIGMEPRAAIYLRQSLDRDGDQLAVTRQREDCQRIAAERGWPIIGEYVDNSVSASDARKHRPAYNRLVDDYKTGAFDALICWDLDRLTRRPRQLEDWIDAAEGRGLLLVTANGEADLTTDAGRLFARIKAAVARAEVERKSARQIRAQRQRAERGLPPAGVRLTGYTIDGKTVPDEAAMVQAVFDRFAAGDSLKGVSRWLGEQGYQTRRGGQWSPSSVSTILTNARYAGRSTYKGQDIQHDGQWEPIVTAEKFAAVQSILADPRRKTNHRGQHRTHLGSGLYVCGVCGTAVHSWSGNRYRCKRGCITRSMRAIDDLVLSVIRGRLADPQLAAMLAPSDDGRAQELAEQARKCRDRLQSIESDYDDGLIDGRRYSAALDKVTAELVAIERERARLIGGGGTASILAAADPAAAFDAAPLMTRQQVIGALCTVRLMPAPAGSRVFRPESVEFYWDTFGG